MAVVITFIKGHTPFPEFSLLLMLDDLTVAYYDSEIQALVPRGLGKEQEDDGVMDPDHVKTVTSYIQADLNHRHQYLKYTLNSTESK